MIRLVIKRVLKAAGRLPKSHSEPASARRAVGAHGRYSDSELIAELRKLRSLIASADEQVKPAVCELITDGVERNYLLELYEKLNAPDQLTSISRTDEMELCRLVNLHLMLVETS